MPAAARSVLVTGGAGYVGIPVATALLDSGRRVRVLDALLHGQQELAEELERRGVELVVGDVRDPAARDAALADVDAVVHLAAIVGDPACARDPELSDAVNVEGTRALVEDARRRGALRLVFASTCSNYGRMSDPSVPIGEDGVLAPVSLYARQKVAIERSLLIGGPDGVLPTCLRFATVYGAAPRMRFDLTVNEFVRDLWADRDLEVFGEQFWRPYVHVGDAARAVVMTLDAPEDTVAGRVFNVGHSDENYRKADLVEIIRAQTDRGRVSFVRRDEDPRDYKVSFARIAEELSYSTTMAVPDGVTEVLRALDENRFGDPFARRHRNID